MIRFSLFAALVCLAAFSRCNCHTSQQGANNAATKADTTAAQPATSIAAGDKVAPYLAAFRGVFTQTAQDGGPEPDKLNALTTVTQTSGNELQLVVDIFSVQQTFRATVGDDGKLNFPPQKISTVATSTISGTGELSADGKTLKFTVTGEFDGKTAVGNFSGEREEAGK